MIEAGPAEALASAVIGSQSQIRCEPEPKRLLDAIEMLLFERKQWRECGRRDPLDASGDKPARGYRLQALHVPAGRDGVAARNLHRVAHPLAEQLRIAERELRLDRDDRGIAVLGDGRTLVGLLPSAMRHRGADAQTDEWGYAAADHDVVETRRIRVGENAPRSQRRRVDHGHACVPVVA